MLFRRRWYILIAFLVVLLLSGIYTYRLVPQYEAVSFVTVDLGKVTLDVGRNLGTSSDAADASFELFARSDRSLAGEIRLLNISDQLDVRVAERLVEESRRGLLGGASDLSLPRVNVIPSPERGSDNIIRFTGRSDNPEQVANVVNLYAEEYVKLTEEASRSQSLAFKESLEEKEKEEWVELSAIEDQIQNLRLSGTVGLDEEASRLIQQIAAVDLERDNILVDLRVERATLASLESELSNINPQIAKVAASGIENRLDFLQEQLAAEEETKAKILIENPELRETETDALLSYDLRISSLNAEIDSLTNVLIDEISTSGGFSSRQEGLNYAADLRREIATKKTYLTRQEAYLTQLDSRLAEYQRSMRNLPRQSMELAQLERNRIRIEQQYQNTTEQLQQALIAEESNTGYAKIIRRAQVPKISIFPDKKRNMILGGFFGLFIGLGLAVLRDKLDNKIYQVEQIKGMGLKELGVVPDLQPLIEREYGDQDSLLLNGQHFSTKLVTYLNPVSTLAESYRHIRTLIQYGVSGGNVQTLLVTSPSMSEGKSTTAANLAIVMAQAGLKTLLIDADLRRPQLHKLFGVTLNNGLIEMLTDTNRQDPELWKMSIENLSLVTAGVPERQRNGSPPKEAGGNALERRRSIILNPSELVGSEQMIELMASFREQYDIIIIDTPPVMVATDAAILSSQTDATILVARASSTKESELNMAVDSLGNVGAYVMGVVLNGFEINMAYGHRFKYQKYGGLC